MVDADTLQILIRFKLTNYKMQSPRETNSCSADQDIPHLLEKPVLHYSGSVIRHWTLSVQSTHSRPNYLRLLFFYPFRFSDCPSWQDLIYTSLLKQKIDV